MNEVTQITDFLIPYKDQNNEEKMILFFEEGKVAQARIFLPNSNEHVTKSFIVYSNKHFIKHKLHFLEKRFDKEGYQVDEYYTDGVMDFYFETIKIDSIIITKGYSPKGNIFSSNRKFLNTQGEIIVELDVAL